MSDLNWGTVGKGDIKDVWQAASPAISKELFNNKMAVVRNLPDASYYDLMTCFCKENKGLVGKEYILMDHISDLVKTSGPAPGTNLNELLNTCSHTIKEEIQTQYNKTWKKGKKSVSVTVEGMKKHVVNWALYTGDLVLNMGLPAVHNIKTVYVISEVVYADNILVEVDIDGVKVESSTDTPAPFAIDYQKFPVDNRGVLGPALDHKVDPEADFCRVEKKRASKRLG